MQKTLNPILLILLVKQVATGLRGTKLANETFEIFQKGVI